MVWVMMSYQGLSELHFVSRGQTVTAEYYVEEVLKKAATSVMQRMRQKGSPTTVKLLPRMTEAILQQDGAPAHNAARTQEWCRDNPPAFWEKGVWLGPCLSRIENLWAIVQGELDKLELATSEKALVSSLQKAWGNISAETRDNLVCGMRERMREYIRLGEHVSVNKPRTDHDLL